MNCRPLAALIAAAGLSASVLCSCSVVPEAPQAPAGPSYWNDTQAGGEPWIEVDLDRQLATFYRGENRMGVAAISSGNESHRTPARTYRILEKVLDKYSTRYGCVEDAQGTVVNADATPGSRVPPGCRYVPAPMPYWMRLTSAGIGMHQGYLPGYAASHGCIRLDKAVARHFYEAAHVGMKVKVIGG